MLGLIGEYLGRMFLTVNQRPQSVVREVIRRRDARSLSSRQLTVSLKADTLVEHEIMCRNIKTLANFAPPATDDEIRASALQFVRKLSGMNKPSKANEDVFNRAIEEVTAAAHRLVHSLKTSAPPRDRDEEKAARRRRARRNAFGALRASGNAAG